MLELLQLGLLLLLLLHLVVPQWLHSLPGVRHDVEVVMSVILVVVVAAVACCGVAAVAQGWGWQNSAFFILFCF